MEALGCLEMLWPLYVLFGVVGVRPVLAPVQFECSVALLGSKCPAPVGDVAEPLQLCDYAICDAQPWPTSCSTA